MVMTSASESSGEGPRWRSFLPLSQSSVRQKTAMMKVLRSTVGDLLCVFGGLDTTEHSGGLVLLSTSQGNLHTGLARFLPSSSELREHLTPALVNKGKKSTYPSSHCHFSCWRGASPQLLSPSDHSSCRAPRLHPPPPSAPAVRVPSLLSGLAP